MGKVFMSGIVEADNTIDVSVSKILNNNSWSKISEHSEDGANYWEIGDCKEIHVKGTVGTKEIDGYYWVYIIGFNHSGAKGIDFGTFKTAQFYGTDICLVDDYYGTSNYDSDTKKWTNRHEKRFNINHGRVGNRGGWKGCDLRYDILGSTNKPPKDYGSNTTTSDREGYDPENYDIIHNPVENTLIAALPLDLRSVMKKMTIWTDNFGGSANLYSNPTRSISYVTESKEYLPLLANDEIFYKHTAYLPKGDSSADAVYSNESMSGKVNQYEYYSNGNSRLKYKHAEKNVPSEWWTRSPYAGSEYRFESIYTSGSQTNNQVYKSMGIAPIFRV